MRYTTAEKLAFAKMHVDENVPIHEIGRKYEFAVSTLKYCCNLYRRYGEAGFRRGEKARTYTREEKLKAIAEIIGGGPFEPSGSAWFNVKWSKDCARLGG